MSFRNTSTGEYPVSHEQVRRALPNAMFPAYFTEAEGFDWVLPTIPPTYDTVTQYVEEGAPEQVDGAWQQTWVVYDFDAEAIAYRMQVEAQRIKQEITVAVQARLDDFAKTRDYDNVLSACSYATSTHAKYGVEGQYCVAAREATWDAMYAFMAEVVAGTRPMPTNYADIEPLLPALAWPN